MENISADDKDKIYHMSLQKKTDSNFKGYGLAKISKKALLNNMKLFRSMPFELSDKEKLLWSNKKEFSKRQLSYN